MVRKWVRRYGGFTVFFFALLPIFFFDLVGLAAGALRFPLWRFLLAYWMGRLPRALVEAYLGAELVGRVFPYIFSFLE
jgi:uncharacterized membrane protein YdjX (TVP38/TMEM64 family)